MNGKAAFARVGDRFGTNVHDVLSWIATKSGRKQAMATRVRLTAEDLWQMAPAEVRRELVDGEIVEMPLNNARHGEVATILAHALVEHVKKCAGGKVMCEVGFVLQLPYDLEQVRCPDLAFISDARLTGRPLPEKFFPGPPDLAVEILSPSDASVYVQQKVRDYLEAGVLLVWLLVPQSKTATVYRADGSARLLRERDSLEGEDILPGFTVRLSDLYD
jgi:Uma2 family endonuclease